MSTKGTYWLWWIFHYYHDCSDSCVKLDIGNHLTITVRRDVK